MIDNVFPTQVSVYKIQDRWTYSIFKNASSSIRDASNHPPKILEQIRKIDQVDIYIRNPSDRFNSGVSTFLEYVQRDVDISPQKMQNFINQYHYNNLHFVPQMFWIVKLLSYVNDNCLLTFKPFEQLCKILDTETKPTVQKFDIAISNPYNNLDMVLLTDFVGKTYTKSQFIGDLKNNHPHIYNTTFKPLKEICAVLD